MYYLDEEPLYGTCPEQLDLAALHCSQEQWRQWFWDGSNT